MGTAAIVETISWVTIFTAVIYFVISMFRRSDR